MSKMAHGTKGKTIDLGDYVDSGSRILSGRDTGRKAREDAGLSDLETKEELIRVSVPDNVLLVASSFFIGMFGESIRNLGAPAFRKKYEFDDPISDLMVLDAVHDVELHKKVETAEFV